MPFVLLFIVVLTVAVITIAILIAKKTNNDANDYELHRADDDSLYKQYIYQNTSQVAKPYINQIFQMIDDINHLAEQYKSSYDKAYYNAVKSIYATAERAEKKIKWCWDNSKFNKDFTFYIGLHYASHLLGLAIKAEQFKIRDTFVKYKIEREREAKLIENLKYRQMHVAKSRKSEIGLQIAEHCQLHKRICILTNQLGEINSLYLSRATQQFIETANRRDYIASHFGERGKKWKERMRLHALQNKRNT